MRKEAKLGLALGGGFGVLLIGYLLIGGGGSERGAEFVRGDHDDEMQSVDVTSEPRPDRSIEVPAPNLSLTPSDGVDLDDPFQTELADGLSGDDSVSPVRSTHRQNAADWARILETGQFTPVRSETPSTPRDPSPPAIDPVTEDEQADAATERRRIPLQLPAEDDRSDEARAAGDRSDADRPAASERTHIVQENETFSSISVTAYGSANHWPQIARANPDIAPERLRPGMEITLPAIETASGRPARDESIDPQRQYRVQQNDSLYRISQKLYGRSDRADDIYDLNRETIGPDPARLRLDMVLELPDPPATTASTR